MTTHLKDLQCKPFSWFLKNVYPEKFILDDPKHVFAYGRLKNPTSNTCLDNLQVSLLKWLTILYLYHSPWTLYRTTTRTLTTWANMLVTISWPVRSSSLSPRSEMIWIVLIWFRTILLWGGGKLKRQLVMWRYELRREDNCAQVSAPFPQRHEKVPTQSDTLILCIIFLGISNLSQLVDNLFQFSHCW